MAVFSKRENALPGSSDCVVEAFRGQAVKGAQGAPASTIKSRQKSQVLLSWQRSSMKSSDSEGSRSSSPATVCADSSQAWATTVWSAWRPTSRQNCMVSDKQNSSWISATATQFQTLSSVSRALWRNSFRSDAVLTGSNQPGTDFRADAVYRFQFSSVGRLVHIPTVHSAGNKMQKESPRARGKNSISQLSRRTSQPLSWISVCARCRQYDSFWNALGRQFRGCRTETGHGTSFDCTEMGCALSESRAPCSSNRQQGTDGIRDR